MEKANTEGTREEFYDSVIDIVQDRMNELNILQSDLAIECNVNKGNLSKYFRREKNLNFTSLHRILNVLDLDMVFIPKKR